MKYLIAPLLALGLANPAIAWDRMLRSDCQLAFERLANMIAPDEGTKTDIMTGSTRVTPDGWCQMKGGDPGFATAEFETFEWRADEVSRWTRDGIPPLALQMRIRGLDPAEMQGGGGADRPELAVDMTLRQLPDAGQIIVENAMIFNDAGDSLLVSGVFERVFLSSPSMMQVSIGSATFKAGLMSMTLDGTHENPFGFSANVEVQGVPQAQRDAAFDMISRMPDGVIDDASRAELTAYAGDLPRPVGTLEVSVASERGLGMMQVGMSMYLAMDSIIEGEAKNSELDILLDGVTVTADWSPAAEMAD